MPILFHSASKEFHLFNSHISYIIQILENQQLGHIYFGRRLADREDFSHLIEYARRDMAPCAFEGNSCFSLEHLQQEYPAFGSGDTRYPAFELEDSQGSRAVDFRFKSYEIIPGKKPLEGLPAVYVESPEEADTLEITLEDALLQSQIILSYTIFADKPVLTKSVRFQCGHPKGITLLNCMSGCLDLPDKDYDMVELAGSWSRERYPHTRELSYGIQSVYSMRGCSSHQFNPFLMLKRKTADEFQGEALGFSLVYSGDFLAQVEVDNYDVTRVTMGIHPNEFRWKLAQGETFQTPELVMVYSQEGINGMSQTFHQLYRTRLARGKWRDLPRPILINNWEATYFKFNEEKILSIAEKAKDIGIELFVLDDGWFGKRNQDNCSLGDWVPNLEKLPNGISGLARKIEGMGLKFGLWFEPEMTNHDSDLFRQHPDWVLADIRRNYCHSRNQYVLDFSRPEVVECIYQQMKKILREAPVSYVKWDMNRSFSEVFSNGHSFEDQGKVRHRYILGVYSLYERLTREFPDILFESCASGGARFDPGMLYYAPQAWTSDNTDAVDRIKIQYGTSYVYPISSMGSHVSASPNHQVFRHTPMEIRANAAYFGTFGYELDITQLPESELEQMKKQIAFMKEHRAMIQQGRFFRLASPFEGNSSAWQVVSPDQSQSLAAYFRILEPANGKFQRIRLRGLQTDAEYSVKERFGAEMDLGVHFGDELMYVGIGLSDCSSGLPGVAREQQGDYFSRLFEITRI